MAIPEQPFGFVAGRWVLSLADTPMDSDRAPDYKPLHPGVVVFNNKLSHRVVADGSGTVGIVKTRIEATLNEDGRIIDAEGHEFIALPIGVYSVTFSFGQYVWPNFDIEVKAEHTVDSPLWLPSKSPAPAGPGVVHVVSEEARLAAEAAAASADLAADRAENAALGVVIDYDLVMGQVEPLVSDAVSVGLAGVNDLVASALVPYATTSALTSGLAGKQDSGDYALVSQLPDVSGLATKSELASGLADKQDTGDYATTTALTSGLAGKQPVGDYVTTSDLGAYATTEYVDQVVGDIDTALAGILGGN